jgi:hypothetical protein
MMYCSYGNLRQEKQIDIPDSVAQHLNERRVNEKIVMDFEKENDCHVYCMRVLTNNEMGHPTWKTVYQPTVPPVAYYPIRQE